MNCPKCKSNFLKPKKLEYGLPAMICSRCGGCHIELLNYRMWRESSPSRGTTFSRAVKEVSDTNASLACPKCQKLMMKYRIKDGVKNKLDLCGSCGEVWLDGGEWQLLESLDLKHEVPEILGAPWQSSIKKKELKNSIEQGFIDELGESDFTKVRDFKVWIENHPKSSLLKNILFRS